MTAAEDKAVREKENEVQLKEWADQKASQMKTAAKYAKEVSRIFGVNAVVDTSDDRAVIIAINLGKFDNKPDEKAYLDNLSNDKPTIHAYKYTPTLDAIFSLGNLDNKPLGAAFAGVGDIPLRITFHASRIERYDVENGAGSWGKDLEKSKSQVVPILDKAKTTIEALEKQMEPALKQEKAYQESIKYVASKKLDNALEYLKEVSGMNDNHRTRCAPVCSQDRWC